MHKTDSSSFSPRPFADGPRRPLKRLAKGKRARLIAGAAVLFTLLGVGVRSASYASLDLIARQPDPGSNPIESAGNTFTGSAYFYVQGAFDIAPQAYGRNDTPNILALRPVETALSSPFVGITPLDRYRALNCLTSAIYYEAGNEPTEGQRAVAQVVLNRVRHPAWPKSVCGVIYQGTERNDLLCQFTFGCDGAMARKPVAAKWARARQVAELALSGQPFAPVGLATHYHTLAVRPDWSSRLDPVAVVGAHIFYQMPGANGHIGAFRLPYSGRELISGPPPRKWKPIPAGEIPQAMPFMPEVEQALEQGQAPSFAAPPRAVAPSYTPGTQPPGWIPMSAPVPDLPGQTLPQSTIRPEYADSGKPL